MIHNFLFPVYNSFAVSAILFICRVVFGTMFLYHGMQKLMNFSSFSANFPDPMGIGHTLSLCLAIFAEVFCTLGFITGFLFRLSTIPMIFTMVMAAFVIHNGDTFAAKELAILYLAIFIILYITGPGSIAADYFFANK